MRSIIFVIFMLSSLSGMGYAASATPATTARAKMQADINKTYEIQSLFGTAEGSEYASAWVRGLGQEIDSFQNQLNALYSLGHQPNANELKTLRNSVSKMRHDAEAAWDKWSSRADRSHAEGAASEAIQEGNF